MYQTTKTPGAKAEMNKYKLCETSAHKSFCFKARLYFTDVLSTAEDAS